MAESSLVRIFALLITIAPLMIMLAYFMVMARGSFKVDKLWIAFGSGAAISFPYILLSQTFDWVIGLGTGTYTLSLKSSLFMAAIPRRTLTLDAVFI